MAIWPYYGQVWPNMVLIAILGYDNFTSQFYVKKRVAIPEKVVLLTQLKTKWPFLAILWPNLAKYRFNYNFGRG